jgi:hypothetical protein
MRAKPAASAYLGGMGSFADAMVPIATGAVAIVLALGLINLMRSGSASRSQLLMRWRVGLQFLAIIVIMATVYFAGR